MGVRIARGNGCVFYVAVGRVIFYDVRKKLSLDICTFFFVQIGEDSFLDYLTSGYAYENKF